MKIVSGTMPQAPFKVLRREKDCLVEFYDNVKAIKQEDGITGQLSGAWELEKYSMDVSPHPGLEAEIESDFAAWLKKAKQAEYSAEAARVRAYRDKLLAECDTAYCNAANWAAMPAANRAEWQTYKQALRGVTEQDGYPYLVAWPERPALVLDPTQAEAENDRIAALEDAITAIAFGGEV